MTYIINTTCLLYANIERVGKVLGQYAIQVSDLQVWNIWQDGSRHRNSPAEKTVKQVAGSFATGGGIAGVGGAALAALLPVIPLPALLAALAANIKLLHRSNKLDWDPRTVSCEVHLALSNVSARRRAWAEYLLGAFCEVSDWCLHKPSASALSGARYARRVGRMPPSWKAERGSGKTGSRVLGWLREH